jgi:hypothetical protein
MSTASTRIAQCFLLVLSILCASTSLPPRAVARAEARGFIIEGGARFRVQQKSSPKIAAPPPVKVDTQGEATWSFMVREGDKESRHERSLATECPAPHRFRVSSRAERILRFEQQTDEITLSSAPRRLTVIIDPAGVKMGASDTREVKVKITVTCLDCKGDKTCNRVKRELVATVIASKRQPAPAPDQGTTQAQKPEPRRPTGQDASLPSKQDSTPARPPINPGQPPVQASDEEAERLSRDGPDVPDIYDLNDFKVRAFLNNGWGLHFVYTLAQSGTVALSVLVDGFPVLVEDFRMNAGRHEELIPLPNPTGKLSVATYSIKAVTDVPPAPGVVPFTLVSLAAGELGASAQDDRLTFPPGYPAPVRGASLTNAAYGFKAAPRMAAVPLGLAGITFTPRDIRLRGDRPSTNATYSFRITVPFKGGARADVKLIHGGTSTLVSSQSYRRRLDVGETLNGFWDCMKDGLPSLGRHELLVRAWFTIQSGGKWSLAHSDPLVVRR